MSTADMIYCTRFKIWVTVDEDCVDCNEEDLEQCGLRDEDEEDDTAE